MSADDDPIGRFERLRRFQESFRIPVENTSRQAPVEALHSLRLATAGAPEGYRKYLDEAVDCYEAGAYRGAILMVWAATIERIYNAIERYGSGLRLIEAANRKRFGSSNAYRPVKKKNDLLYLTDKNLFLICEDAGLFNRNARKLLDEKLDTRNRCGHPTGYVLGREEAVVFIESLINNIINEGMLDWT